MKAAIFDFDGVFTEESSAVGYMEYLVKHGAFRKDSLVKIKEASDKYFDGELTYQETNDITGREWLKGIKGRKRKELKRLAEEFVEDFKYDRRGKKVVDHFRDREYLTIMMSSSPIEIIEIIANNLDVQEVVAATAKTEDGRYVEEFKVNMAGENRKAEYIEENLDHIDLGKSYGFGDSPHDLSFLELVGNPIVIRPTDEMKKIAEKREWNLYKDLGAYLEVLRE